MKWTKYIPAFLITGLLFLLLSVIVKNTVLVISLRVVSFILILLNIVFYGLFKKWNYSDTKMNKVLSTIMLPVFPLIVITLFTLLFWSQASAKDVKILKKGYKSLDLFNGVYVGLGYTDSVREHKFEILDDDTTNKEYTLKITRKEKQFIYDESSITCDLDSYDKYGFELKEVYFDDTLLSYEIVDNKKVFNISDYPIDSYVMVKLVYEAKASYIEYKDYRAFCFIDVRPENIVMDGFDSKRIDKTHRSSEYILYSSNTPEKYVMAGYNYYMGSIVLAYIIYITSTIVVVGKTICFFMYYKSKEVEAE